MSLRAARLNSRESIEARIQMEEAEQAEQQMHADLEEDNKQLAWMLDEDPDSVEFPDSSGFSNRGSYARGQRTYGQRRSWDWFEIF